jgi:hypothetical protein
MFFDATEGVSLLWAEEPASMDLDGKAEKI